MRLGENHLIHGKTEFLLSSINGKCSINNVKASNSIYSTVVSRFQALAAAATSIPMYPPPITTNFLHFFCEVSLNNVKNVPSPERSMTYHMHVLDLHAYSAFIFTFQGEK